MYTNCQVHVSCGDFKGNICIYVDWYTHMRMFMYMYIYEHIYTCMYIDKYMYVYVYILRRAENQDHVSCEDFVG